MLKEYEKESEVPSLAGITDPAERARAMNKKKISVASEGGLAVGHL